MDQHKEFRIIYLGAAPHTLITVLTWLISGLFWEFSNIQASILVIIIGGMLIFPLGELLRKFMMKDRRMLCAGNKLPQLLMLLAFMWCWEGTPCCI